MKDLTIWKALKMALSISNFSGRASEDVLVKKDIVRNLVFSGGREFRRLLLVMLKECLDDSWKKRTLVRCLVELKNYRDSDILGVMWKAALAVFSGIVSGGERR